MHVLLGSFGDGVAWMFKNGYFLAFAADGERDIELNGLRSVNE
jgi:hypothetical protein